MYKLLPLCHVTFFLVFLSGHVLAQRSLDQIEEEFYDLAREIAATNTSNNTDLANLNALLTSLKNLENSTAEMTLSTEWKIFKIENNKTYTGEEDARRFKEYKETDDLVDNFNDDYEAGQQPFAIEINEYADWTDEEIDDDLEGAELPDGAELDTYDDDWVYFDSSSYRAEAVPASFDWRDKGAVGPVLDQRECGSCWAFTTAAAIEAAIYKTQKKSLTLSKQQILDCVVAASGCKGGFVPNAMNYVINGIGLTTDDKYPYQNRKDNCSMKTDVPTYKINSIQHVAKKNETELMKTVFLGGPVAVHIDSSDKLFTAYKKGVFYVESCKNTSKITHAMLVVGYGTDARSGYDYWLLKNTWGTTWGEQGYMRMARNKDNHCGIASWASIPIIGKPTV